MAEFLLIAIDGRRYAIRKENISSIQNLQHLHRLPLSPSFIAGVSIIDGRTATIADLAACLGHSPLQEHIPLKIAMLPGEQNISGFAFSGEAETRSVPPDALLPVPSSVKIDFLEECIVQTGLLIPVINFEKMWSCICKKEPDPAEEILAERQGLDKVPPDRIHIVRLGADFYGIPGSPADGLPENPGQVVELPLLPTFLKGIMLHRGTILPLVDLNAVMYGANQEKAGCLVETEIRGERYGLLAEEEAGVLVADDAVCRDLPPIARSSLLSNAILQSGTVIPVVDPDAVSAPGQGRNHGGLLSEHYTPDLQFLSLFMKQDVELVEFLLLGAKHALPKCEVEDVIPLKNYRPIPFAPPIVAGVTEHNGSILAVLDPGLIFGRRSRVQSDWSMILLKNGDFRALILTEAAVGSCMLSVDSQRTVPILLPHHVVYGCYPDQNSVRLILNMHAIAVHFEQALVQDMLTAFQGGMQQAIEDIPAIPRERPASFAAATGARDADQQPYPESEGETLEPVVRTEQENAEEAAEESRPIPVGTAAQSAPAQAAAPSPEEIQEQTPPAVEAAALQESEIQDERVEAAVAQEQPVTFSLTGEQSIGQDQASLSAATEAQETERDWEARSLTAPFEQCPEQQDMFPAADTIKEKEAERAAEAALPALGSVPDPQMPVVPQPEPPRVLTSPDSSRAGLHFDRFSSETEPRPVHSNRKRMVAVGIIAAMIGLFFYTLPVLKRPVQQKPAVAVISPEENVAALKAPEPKIPEKTAAPLFLEIPADHPTDITLYIVVTGDTLWSISERFTGNPFNYPRIAGENRIADPDMIFPGQMIRLEMKKK